LTARFEGLVVCVTDVAVFARNAEDRPLFRFNKVTRTFAVFRSRRMTDDEKEFCLIMLKKLTKREDADELASLTAFLDYKTVGDIYCG